MNIQDLQARLSLFEAVMTSRVPPQMNESSVTRALREVYARKYASAVLSCVQACYPEDLETALKLAVTEHISGPLPLLPRLDVVRNGARELIDAVAGHDGSRAVSALKDLGIFALCPSRELQFSRLEYCVGCVIGRARLIPLVELAIFAADENFLERSSVYIEEAHSLVPEAPELHDLHTVAGLIVLDAGDVPGATKYLAESIRVCEENDFACLQCSVSTLNLRLAVGLIQHDQRASVIKYLSKCKEVWTYDAKRIASWIEAIQCGQSPEFLAPSILCAMNHPAEKMGELVMRSSFRNGPIDPADRNSARDTKLGMDRKMTEYRRLMATAIKGKLGLGKN